MGDPKARGILVSRIGQKTSASGIFPMQGGTRSGNGETRAKRSSPRDHPFSCGFPRMGGGGFAVADVRDEIVATVNGGTISVRRGDTVRGGKKRAGKDARREARRRGSLDKPRRGQKPGGPRTDREVASGVCPEAGDRGSGVDEHGSPGSGTGSARQHADG